MRERERERGERGEGRGEGERKCETGRKEEGGIHLNICFLRVIT